MLSRYSLRYETRPESASFLSNINSDHADDNIDFYHMNQAREAIDAWFRSRPPVYKFSFLQTLLNDDEAGKNVKVIWYQLSDQANVTEVFSRLNRGKIPLTNAELVKALLLNAGNFSQTELSVRFNQLRIAQEWDETERRLQQEDFWYFISNHTRESNRIEFILGLVADSLKSGSLLMEFLTGSDLLGACRFYALCAFITAKRSSIDARFAEQHAQWSRVTDNFLYTMRIDSNQVAVGIIRSLDELAPYADDIYCCLRTVEVRLGFNEQWDEEVLKAKLITLDSEWETALVRAESHPHLKGRIRGLLKGAKTADNSGYDLTRFISLTEKTYWVLNEQVLHNYEHLLERALLSLGDYLIWQKGQRYTFCLPSHQSWRERNENWLRVTEKSVFVELLDKLNKKEDISNTLREIIQESNPGGWRELIVKDPETIRYCSERIIDKLDNQVYLLSKTNLRGYFRELHSWVLSKRLLALLRREDGNTPFTAVTYHSVYGDAWPCIELTVSEEETFFIAHENGAWFDCHNVDEEGEPLPLPPFFKSLVDTLMHEADTVSRT
ncbi:Protein of uncharacterised function DUF262 [Yersinia enterocolitica]|nr:Protein of uncharacterised function DUF262 [Yersinia enterocolitica]